MKLYILYIIYYINIYYILYIYSYIYFIAKKWKAFKNLVPTLPTMQCIHQVRPEAIMCSFLCIHKKLYSHRILMILDWRSGRTPSQNVNIWWVGNETERSFLQIGPLIPMPTEYSMPHPPIPGMKANLLCPGKLQKAFSRASVWFVWFVHSRLQ